jgi:hypothetical protein
MFLNISNVDPAIWESEDRILRSLQCTCVSFIHNFENSLWDPRLRNRPCLRDRPCLGDRPCLRDRRPCLREPRLPEPRLREPGKNRACKNLAFVGWGRGFIKHTLKRGIPSLAMMRVLMVIRMKSFIAWLSSYKGWVEWSIGYHQKLMGIPITTHHFHHGSQCPFHHQFWHHSWLGPCDPGWGVLL